MILLTVSTYHLVFTESVQNKRFQKMQHKKKHHLACILLQTTHLYLERQFVQNNDVRISSMSDDWYIPSWGPVSQHHFSRNKGRKTKEGVKLSRGGNVGSLSWTQYDSASSLSECDSTTDIPLLFKVWIFLKRLSNHSLSHLIWKVSCGELHPFNETEECWFNERIFIFTVYKYVIAWRFFKDMIQTIPKYSVCNSLNYNFFLKT